MKAAIIGLAGFVALATAPGASAEPVELEPGLWRVQVLQVTSSDGEPVNNETPQSDTCLTPEYARDPGLLLAPDPRAAGLACDRTVEPQGSTTIWHIDCRQPDFFKRILISARFDTARHFTSTNVLTVKKVKARDPAEDYVDITARMDWRWTAADCPKDSK